jgi:hypothetical protein
MTDGPQYYSKGGRGLALSPPGIYDHKAAL